MLEKIWHMFSKREKPLAIAQANEAIAMVNDLTNHMRCYSASNDPVKALMSDLWQHRNNVPFLTSVYETIEEVKPPPDLRQNIRQAKPLQ